MRFTARGVPVLQVYGSTETCPIAVYTRLGGDLSRDGSTGLPGLCCEARVVDDAGNEVPPGIAGRSRGARPQRVLRILGQRGGDRARRCATAGIVPATSACATPTGYFFIHDRKKNMIISGGENIYPAEVERVLLEHPDVAECAVIGRPDPKWQEVPVAYVVRRAGCRVRRATRSKAHLLTQLARFKVPRDIVFVDDLPRNALGKVQHFLLSSLTAGTAQGEADVKIAVLGGGNGSFAAAGDFALQGHEVRLWRRDAAAVAAHRAAGSRILVKDLRRPPRRATGAGDDRHRRSRPRCRADPVPCPAPSRSPTSRALLAPHLRDGQVVFLPPATFGSMHLRQGRARRRQSRRRRLSPRPARCPG